MTNENDKAGYQEKRITAPLTTITLEDRVVARAETLKTYEKRIQFARSFLASSHSELTNWELNLRSCAMHVQENADKGGFEGYAYKLSKENVNNKRLGAIYLQELWFIVHDAELTSKLHSTRVVAQFMRDTSFLMNTQDDVPNFWIHGEAASGKSNIVSFFLFVCLAVN